LDINALEDPDLVKNAAKLLSILSKRDNLDIFISADSSNNNEGLKAKSSTIQELRLSKKVYYTRLKQLINAGLIEKSDGIYKRTTLGNIIFQNNILNLMERLKHTKQMKMVDTLKRTKQFSEDEIVNFVNKITGGANSSMLSSTNASSTKIEIALTYQKMVSAIIERVEFCKNEILLASRSLNEIIINNILRKADSGISVKVLTDSSLVKQYFEVEGKTLKLKDDDNDKNTTERIKIVSNPWYPSKVNRRIAKIPFSMIILDGKEVGIEMVNWNESKNFYGTIFIRGDKKTSKIMQDLYYKIWDNASSELQQQGQEQITESSSIRM